MVNGVYSAVKSQIPAIDSFKCIKIQTKILGKWRSWENGRQQKKELSGWSRVIKRQSYMYLIRMKNDKTRTVIAKSLPGWRLYCQQVQYVVIRNQ